MRFQACYTLAGSPDRIRETIIGPADIVRAEREYKAGIGELMRSERMEPFFFMLHNALMRELRKDPEAFSDGLNPSFEKWVEDLADFDIDELAELSPKASTSTAPAT